MDESVQIAVVDQTKILVLDTSEHSHKMVEALRELNDLEIVLVTRAQFDEYSLKAVSIAPKFPLEPYRPMTDAYLVESRQLNMLECFDGRIRRHKGQRLSTVMSVHKECWDMDLEGMGYRARSYTHRLRRISQLMRLRNIKPIVNTTYFADEYPSRYHRTIKQVLR